MTLDAVRLSDGGHRGEVVLDHLQRRGAGVAGDVVGAGEDHYRRRVQRDDVLLEAHQQLWCRLSADAASDVGESGELLREEARPPLGDRVAVEDDALLAGCRSGEAAVLVAVAGQKGPVVMQALLGGVCGAAGAGPEARDGGGVTTGAGGGEEEQGHEIADRGTGTESPPGKEERVGSQSWRQPARLPRSSDHLARMPRRGQIHAMALPMDDPP